MPSASGSRTVPAGSRPAAGDARRREKRVVYAAYFFPPTGGAGVQRTLKFVRHLPSFGWTTVVVTTREEAYWMRDPTLLAEVPPEARVVRTRAWTGLTLLGVLRGRPRPPSGPSVPAEDRAGEVASAPPRTARREGSTQGRLRRAASWLFVPDSYLGWVPFARRAVARELERGGVLVTTSSPDSAHLIGLGLVAGRGIGAGPAGRRIPWVADFRDPWVRRMSLSPPTALHARAHEALEARVVRACTRMIVTSEATRRDYLARYPELDPGKIVTITNGYDEEDFAGVPVAPARDFRLVHVGQLNPERPIGPLLDHLEAFFAIRPRARTETIVEMIGPRYAEDEAEAERRGFGRLVRFAGAVAHRQAIERMLAARVLVLLEQESERGALILPGKIFEYLRSGRPVFGLVPRGAAWELLEETRAGRAALPSSPRDGAAILAGLYDRWSAGETLEPPSDRARIASFERRPLTARLAALLDDLLS